MTKIVEVDLKETMEFCYTDYAFEVIKERALPDVKDGLKNVHRRILFSAHELGLTPDKGYRKSARIVGEVLGKYHPHGDTSVYDAMVKMAQDWYLRYPLMDGHGNFGSVDGDSPAAMRYTEIKQSLIYKEMIKDIDKNTVDFIPNFDGEEKEPTVLPSRFPNLLVNGAFGIAVGVATNIPPHNLTEVINGVVYQIDNPNCTIQELTQYIKSADFPTGGIILNPQDMVEIYEKGYGKILLRGKHHIETIDNKEVIVFTEIPYQVNKAKLVDTVYTISKDQKEKDKSGKEKIIKAKIPEIEVIRDESDREGMRIVIIPKKKNTINTILGKLFKYSDFQINFSVNMTVLNDKELLEKISLKEVIKYYIEHQKNVLTRRSQYELKKAKDRIHIVEGLKKALENLDLTIKLIRESKTKQEAKDKLINNLLIDEIQANAILELRLQRLVNLEISALINEYNELLKTISKLEIILNNEGELLSVLKNELLEIKEKYGDKRLTQISELNENAISYDTEDLEIEDYSVTMVLSKQGYIKKTLRYADKERQKVKDTDEILEILQTKNKSEIVLIGDKGNAYKIQTHTMNETQPSAIGDYIYSVFNIDKEENIIGMLSITPEIKGYAIIPFANGKIVKIPLSSYETKQNRSKLQNSLSLDSPVVSILQITEDTDIYLESSQNKSLIINTSNINEKATRNSQGVQTMKSNKQGFEVVKAEIYNNQVDESYRVNSTSAGKSL